MYSNPPMMGAHLVANILGDPTLKQRWYKEVRIAAATMAASDGPDQDPSCMLFISCSRVFKRCSSP